MAASICPVNQLACLGFNSTKYAFETFCIKKSQFHCEHFPVCECPNIKADPDIAGIGMIAAFTISASLALVFTTISLILHRKDPENSAINPIDNFFWRHISAPLRRRVGPERADYWAECLFSMILTISDQQLVTGIAILVAAIHSLEVRSISVYHFNIVMDMAWLSSNTHLLSLLVMRTFLDFSEEASTGFQKHKGLNDVPRGIRIVAMVALATLLLYCANVASYEFWDQKLNCPALCVRLGKRGGLPLKQMIITYVFIIQSYTTQILRVTPSARRLWAHRIQPWVIERDQRTTERVRRQSRSVRRAYSGVKMAALASWYFFTSEFEFILEMMAWYGLGLYWTFTDRDAGHKRMDQSDVIIENHIGFAQLVPLLLLMLAFLALVETYKSENKKLESGLDDLSVRRKMSESSSSAAGGCMRDRSHAMIEKEKDLEP